MLHSAELGVKRIPPWWPKWKSRLFTERLDQSFLMRTTMADTPFNEEERLAELRDTGQAIGETGRR